jgi:hypothetical protein
MGPVSRQHGAPEILTLMPDIEYLSLHQAYVERAISSVRKGEKARVHYFNVKEGWEPLCKILDLPIPDVPFPQANDAQATQDALQGFVTTALMRWAILIGILSVSGYWLWMQLFRK